MGPRDEPRVGRTSLGPAAGVPPSAASESRVRALPTASIAALVLAACVGHPNPACTGPLGIDGRPLPVCDGVGEIPVCDTGTTPAFYEMNEFGAWVLRDGTLAFCDEADVVACADRSVAPRCLFKPT